jgi:hypothetical protein
MKLVYLLFSLLLLSSCVDRFTEQEVLGVYTPVDYKNCFDTIRLKKNGVYHRKVYDIKKHLLLDMKGKWNFYNEEKSQIQFHSFYLNLDDNLIKFPELVQDTVGGGAFNLERNNNTIAFCVGYYSASLPNQNCYQKQE